MGFLSKLLGRTSGKRDHSALQPPDTYYLNEAVKGLANYDEVRELVAEGADVNADYLGDIPLVEAASDRSGSSKMVELLIELGADVNRTNEEGETALMAAMVANNFDSAETLIKHGADVNARDTSGRTVLLKLSEFGDVRDSNLEILVGAGADVNVADKDGNTALMESLGSLHSVQALLDAGADPSLKNNEGLTALDVARAEAEQHGGAERAMVIQLLESGKVTAPEKGWMISWRADDVDPSDGDRQVLLRDLSQQVSTARSEMRHSVLASGALPFGGYIVFDDRPNAQKIASILSTRGGPSVQIREVQYDLETNEWLAGA